MVVVCVCVWIDAVKVLKEIGEKLGINGTKEWDLDKNPCSGEGNWGRGEFPKGFEVSVNCDCSFEQNATCRVVRMYVFLIWLWQFGIQMLIREDEVDILTNLRKSMA